ncbi:MAG: LacI family transcriptional regulator [Verrucomicrobia bacterium]|nr:LacI family transcriptional regulator [Verrucomicrobiota bacterium]MCF7709404.1 LacI family transcriptional regulator [Verrucomicrobiota bacterium]
MMRLKDIAEMAGVSIMTVSKALRNSPEVSCITKARILKLARQCGYVPNSNAQGLRTRKTGMLALVISSSTHPIHAPIEMSIQEHVFALGYALIVTHSLNDPAREDEALLRLAARCVDGLFIAPANRIEEPDVAHSELFRNGTPIVIIGHRSPFCSGLPCVETDDISATYELTRHLIDLGHKQIAFISGMPLAVWSRERMEGYKKALSDHDLLVEDRLIFKGGSTIEEGAAAALQIINENIKPTAVIAANDLLAVGALNTFLDNGIRVPEKLSLAGFGNILLSEFCRVPLTTVELPKHRIGRVATETMQKILNGKSPESIRLKCDLVIRKSTAAPGR